MTTVTTHNPVRADLTATAEQGTDRTQSSRGWAVAGIGAALLGMGTIVTSSAVDVVYRDEFSRGSIDGVAEALSDKTGVMFAFHSITTLGAVLMVVFAAGLFRRLRTAMPDSIAPVIALVGLAGTAVVSVLGAGLDTFAYRNPFSALRIFEVDFPATQEWKHGLLAEAGIGIPDNLTYIALDLEHKSLAESLIEAGFNPAMPAFFSWLGVVPYLTIDAFRATLTTIGRLPVGSAVSFDYAFPPHTLSAKRRQVFDTLAKRVAAAGEPLQLFFTPEEIEREARVAGFSRIEQFDTDRMNATYLKDRADGLKLSPVRVGMLATAWV